MTKKLTGIKIIISLSFLVTLLLPVATLAEGQCCVCWPKSEPEGQRTPMGVPINNSCATYAARDNSVCNTYNLACEDPKLQDAIKSSNASGKQPVTPPTLEVTIPNLNLSTQVQTLKEVGQLYYEIPWIAEYVSKVYKFGVFAAAILAIMMIIIGGFVWLIAGGNQERVSSAKNYITGALIGLVIALGSYGILKVVNPSLVHLKPLKISMIKYEELPEWELTSDYGVETAPGVPPPGSTSNLVSIAGTPGANIGCSDPQCVEQCANGFKAAVAKMKAQGYTVSLGPGSCHRSVAAQNTNPSALKCKCKDANCSNCPHVRGVALDVTCSQEKVPWSKMRESGLACKGKPACQGQFATRSDYNCQNLLIKAMRESGMCKLYFEDWHFQPKGTSGACF